MEFPYVQTQMEWLIQKKNSITEDEFKKLKDAYELILKKIWIDEKYNMILDNYIDIQLECLEAEGKLSVIQDRNEMIVLGKKYIVNLNRRLSNFLCSVRMYIDQTQHDLSSLGIQTCTKQIFHEFTAQEYDSRLGYQIMELLRNYIQHQGLIIDGLTIIRPMFSNNCSTYINIIAEIEYKRLKMIDNYSKKIKQDDILQNACSKRFNLLWFLEEYVNGIIVIHEKLSEKLSQSINESASIIEGILQKSYESIPYEVAIFGEKTEFLMQNTFINQVRKKQRVLESAFGDKQVFKTTDRITGNFQKDTIKYNMI